VGDERVVFAELRDLQLRGEYDEGQAETPLLDAFADGKTFNSSARGG
jgi:hypothetical protein